MKDSATPVLIVAHPGHELRIHHWLESMRPTTMVLTDGSGSQKTSRVSSTAQLLARTGCEQSAIFGRYTDQAIYKALLDRDETLFIGLTLEIAEILTSKKIDTVVGDALEGFNPTHDMCRIVIGAAVEYSRNRHGAKIANFDFAVDGHPGTCEPSVSDGAVFLKLDEPAMERKLKAAQDYPELRDEVTSAIQKFGLAPFQNECLRPVKTNCGQEWTKTERPFYEILGEKRAAAGAVLEAIYFKSHVQPIARAIWNVATS